MTAKSEITNKWDNYSVGKDHKSDLQFLQYELSQKFDNYDDNLIHKAFNWTIAAHRNQIRKSGQPYYTHPLEVARIIINEIPLDDVSVAAALLHDACDNSDFSIQDIETEFGREIYRIVKGISQIQVISKFGIKNADSYRKIIITWFSDIRIIIIALADRLHNMRTVEFLSPDAQQRLAQETMDIYAPFANRFGLGSFKWELEDLAFKILNPTKYDEIIEKLQLSKEDRKLYVKEFIKPLHDALTQNLIFSNHNISFEISGRAKHIYSIAMKEILREKNMDELYDLFAVRIIVDNENIEYCYAALEAVTQVYQPIPGTLKDYIKEPKENGYQSIHLAVIGMLNKPVEVQIRTKQMHEYAENGMAAHFKYKPGNVSNDSILEQENYEEWIDSIRSIFENRDYESIREKSLMPSALHIDSITVLTHTLESKNLPANSTALDFAYAIHTEIGNTCIGAKVNGKIVPLSYPLSNGDQVEILNSNTSHPEKAWLDIVRTEKAKYALKNHFKQEELKYKKSGFDKWINLQKEYSTQLSETEFDFLVRDLKFANSSDFFVSLGNSSIDIDYIDNYLLKKLSLEKNNFIDNRDFKSSVSHLISNVLNQLNSDNSILMECCMPMPGDRIIGEMIENTKLNIHRRSCKKVAELLNPPRPNIISLSWQQLDFMEFPTKILIIAEINDNIIPQVTGLLAKYDRINIKGINFNTDNDQFKGTLKLSISSIYQYNQLLEDMRQIEGVQSAERV